MSLIGGFMFNSFLKALRLLYQNDGDLLKKNVDLLSINHKLACYLQGVFIYDHIDINYDYSMTQPIIMIHKRNSTIHNKMVIQCIHEDEAKDLGPLKTYTSQYKNNLNFEMGILVVVNKESNGSIYTIEEGKISNKYYYDYTDCRIQVGRLCLPHLLK